MGFPGSRKPQIILDFLQKVKLRTPKLSSLPASLLQVMPSHCLNQRKIYKYIFYTPWSNTSTKAHNECRNQLHLGFNLIEAPTAPATHMTTRQRSKPRRPLSITTTIKETPSSPDMIKLKVYLLQHIQSGRL